MAGYGNHTAPNYENENLNGQHTSTRLGLTDSHGAYSNAHPKYGSGATGGAGFGNKSNALSSSTTAEETRYGLHTDTAPYSGATRVGSGSTAGAGYGNKTGSFSSGTSEDDSTLGKAVEKAGHVLHNAKVEEKGRAMREEQKHSSVNSEEGPFAN